MIRYCLLTCDRDPILWDFDTPHPPGGMITTPDGANIHAADSSERRNIEAMRRLRWELGGRLDVV
jgi:hypothetical protein